MNKYTIDFNKFNEQAIKAIKIAQQAARIRNINSVNTLHILYGILSVIKVNVLSLEHLKCYLTINNSKQILSIELPFSEEASYLLSYVVNTKQQVSPEYILFYILQDDDCLANTYIKSFLKTEEAFFILLNNTTRSLFYQNYYVPNKYKCIQDNDKQEVYNSIEEINGFKKELIKAALTGISSNPSIDIKDSGMISSYIVDIVEELINKLVE